jgi:hypothetical protein
VVCGGMEEKPQSADRILASFAALQHGLVTKDQAYSAGLMPHHLHDRGRNGRWVAVYDNVFRLAGAPETVSQRRLAAVLAVGSLAAVSHRAAAEMHGLWTSRPPTVEISTTRKHSP